MIDELTDYLQREADRVRVHDTLRDILDGVARVPVVPDRRVSRWLAPAFVGAAAAAIVLFGLAATSGPAQQQATVPGAVGGTPAPIEESNGEPVPAGEPVPVDEAAEPVATTPQPVRIPLPDGATMQGLTPSCTTNDGIEFDCAVQEDYRNASGWYDGGFDHTGETQAIITADAVVSGGCRSTSADGSTWHCALGQRAVELDMIGPNFLGESSPPGFAHG